MNAVEIIMQQKRIAAEKEKADKKLVYDTIKKWVENRVDKFGKDKINLITKKFANGECDRIEYRCISGRCNFPLGEEFPKDIGRCWIVRYIKNGREMKALSLRYADLFFDKYPFERTEYNCDTLDCFVSYLLWEEKFPQMLKEEGFVVNVQGRGCCQTINVTLPML